jgi:peroxiredoxin
LVGATIVNAGGGAEVAGKAPEFTLSDSSGQQVSLADSAGKIRVLEWINPDCPFVKRHYQAGTMKQLAEKYKDDVVWLAVNSTHYMDLEQSEKFRQQHKLPYPVLIDSDGAVGHSYGAATTPHLFIIDGNGKLVYRGAIDDDPRGAKDAARSFVDQALSELLAGKSVSITESKPYGCSVKYANLS